MGQAEILKLLRKHPDKWFSKNELCRLLERSDSSINLTARKLVNQGEVVRQKIRKESAMMYFYKLKT